MYHINMKTSTLTKALLIALVGGCIVVAPGSIFAIGALVKLLGEAQYSSIPVKVPEESDPENVRRSLYRLKKNKYIKIRKVGKQKFKLELTKKGRKLLERYNFTDFKLKPNTAWDGQWRIFVFDIPEKRRAMRDALRDKLKKLGFFQFQKSVWIYPFECEEEMEYICEFVGVQNFTLIFTGRIHNDHLLRKYFIMEEILKKPDLYIQTKR